MLIYHIQIKSFNNYFSYKNVRYLKKHGFYYIESNASWCKNCSYKELKMYTKFCRRKKLKLNSSVTDKRLLRNSSYRKDFFDNTSPFFTKGVFKGCYICTYCGKLLPPSDIYVDHIIPISKAQKSAVYCMLLKKTGSGNVNQFQNLCASCFKCNNIRKRDKAGFWVIRGYLFSHKSMQIVRILLKSLLCICLYLSVLILIWKLGR